MRLLLAEDDLMLGESLKQALESEGYAVDWVKTGDDAIQAVFTGEFDIAIFDWRMPIIDGVTAIGRLRIRGDKMPILMLTARDELADKVNALDIGADDYIVKPFIIEELFARLRVLYRRRKGSASPTLRCGQLTLNPANKEVELDNEKIELSVREFTVLQRLIECQGRFCSKTSLTKALYSWDNIAASNTIEVYIARLRRALGADWIKTRRGVGYKINPL